MSNHYATLGVARDATQKEIAKAFRARARVLHPDKQPPSASEAAKQRATRDFQELSKAYEVLSDVDQRAHYDFTIRETSMPAPSGTAAATGGGRSGAPAAAPQAQGTGQGRREQPTSAGGSSASGAGRAPDRPQAEATDRRTGDWDYRFDTPAEQAARRRQREAREEEERRRWHEAEKERGLGAHWVKPPEYAGASKAREPWKGWAQSGKVEGNAARRADADDSDDSSVLSFDIGGIDLSSLNLDDLQPLDGDGDLGGGWGAGEVWKINHAAENPQADERNGSSAGQVARHTASRPKPCCSMQ